jgi:hypothetical protein
MRSVRVCVATLVAAVLLPVAANASRTISVRVNRAEIATTIGHRFVFRSTIANHGSTTARGLIAHLNVLSLYDGVYVDPEDWSSHRTHYLAPIPAGGAASIAWPMEAVNAGSFAVYVAALPSSSAPRPPTTGATIRVDVAKRQTLDSAGVVPLALGIPALLGLLALGIRLRRRV